MWGDAQGGDEMTRVTRAGARLRVVPLILAGTSIASGCDILGVDCTAEVVYGVNVRAYDAETGEPVHIRADLQPRTSPAPSPHPPRGR